LRALVFGAARTPATAIESEIVVMQAPGRVVASDVAAGSPIQQGDFNAIPRR
jgi:hypothetical protein